MCSHLYLWHIWTTWRCKQNTVLSDIWATAGLPGSQAAVWFGHRAAGANPPPLPPVSFHVVKTFISVEATGLQLDEYCLSVVRFLLMKNAAFHIPSCFYEIVLWCFFFLLKWMWHLQKKKRLLSDKIYIYFCTFRSTTTLKTLTGDENIIDYLYNSTCQGVGYIR